MVVELPKLERMLVPIDSGKITTPIQKGKNSLSDQTKMWRANIFVNHLVRVTDPSGRREIELVAGNGGSTIVIRDTWLLNFPAGSDYEILAVSLMQAFSDVFVGIEKANEHNTAEAANTDILAVALSPKNTPCLFRVMVAFDTPGIFRATITKAGNTQTVSFNNGVNLSANCLYIFDHLVHIGDTINYQYSANAQLMVLRVQEIIAGVQ